MAALAALAGSSLLSSKAALGRQQPFASARLAVAARPAARPMVLAMAKPTKADDFRSLSNEDIEVEISGIARSLLELRIKFAKREDFKPDMRKWLKRKRAQLLTVMRERELVEGMKKRESRAADKRRMVEAGLGRF